MATRFPATLFKIQVDKEAEAKITLVVPSDSLDKVLPLLTMSEQLLSVEIGIDPSQG